VKAEVVQQIIIICQSDLEWYLYLYIPLVLSALLWLLCSLLLQCKKHNGQLIQYDNKYCIELLIQLHFFFAKIITFKVLLV